TLTVFPNQWTILTQVKGVIVSNITVYPDVLGGPFVVSGALAAPVVACYTLDEAANAAAVDAYTLETLTQFGGVGSAPGKVGLGRLFNAVNKTYLRSTNPRFSLPTGDFTVSAWINPTSFVGSDTAVGVGIVGYIRDQQAGSWWIAL